MRSGRRSAERRARLLLTYGYRMPQRRTLLYETFLVLGVSLGASALRALLTMADRLTRPEPLGQQTTRMNVSTAADRPWLDLAVQLSNIVLALIPALLAIYLLTRDTPDPLRRMGFDLRRPGFDVGWGFGLAAIIGIPGLGLYLVAREYGVNTTVATVNLADVWWTIPVLVLASAKNALLEQIIMIGYLFTRWRQAGWNLWVIIVVSAVIRGTYHVYQGFGAFIGNVAMGLIIGVFYARTKRLMPAVIAHFLIDVVAFVGYAALVSRVGWL